jgi:hypothetical protein
MKCMMRMNVEVPRGFVKMCRRPLPRYVFARITLRIRSRAEPRTNAALQVVQTLAQSYDRCYDGQGPLPKTVKELPSVLALLLRLLVAILSRLNVIHGGSPLG